MAWVSGSSCVIVLSSSAGRVALLSLSCQQTGLRAPPAVPSTSTHFKIEANIPPHKNGVDRTMMIAVRWSRSVSCWGQEGQGQKGEGTDRP